MGGNRRGRRKGTQCKIITILLIIIITSVLVTGCRDTSSDIKSIIADEQQKSEEVEERKHIRIGILVGPYADMISQIIAPALISKGYTIETIIFTEWDATNMALTDGNIDLNLFQHSHFLNNFKSGHDAELSAVAEVPTASMVLLSERFETLGDIEPGSSIALPSDATNLARALRILREADIISLDNNTDISRVTLDDIDDNPKELEFNLVDGFEFYSEQIAGSDAVVISGGRAYASGINLSDALYSEVLREGYMIVAVVRTEDLARQYVSDIMDIIHSDEFRQAIEDEDSPFSGFQRPNYFYR
ncbi:MAG: MetQ/NlpA family ABC transporter substrate-binding protein [Oscillospiraceae bacterium]|nr:MetQ/NlpA family ABC transporter substrate-binding protein [Oscillospiraceae bacterium]